MKLNNKVNYLEDNDTLFVLQKTKGKNIVIKFMMPYVNRKMVLISLSMISLCPTEKKNTVFKQIINEKFQSEMEFLEKRISESEKKNEKN